MIVLALDTAGADCAAAVYDSGSDPASGRILGEVTETIGKGHAERLMALIDAALEKAGVTLQQIERIAVSIGPGSFTGIRVGVAAARGFALSLGIPAVGITTLETLAATKREAANGRAVLAAIDAKRDEIYLQAFAADGEPLSEPQALPTEDAKAYAASFDGIITGSATEILGQDEQPLDHPFPIAVVAKLGAAKPVGEKPKPLYLRGPDAKPQAQKAIARR